MANLSNINNKFIVTDGGQALINQTAPGFNVDADDLIVGNLSGNTGITIASGPNAGNYGSLYFADAAGQGTASKAGYIRYEQNTSKMTIGINAVEKIAIALNGDTTFTGNVGIGITPNTSFSGVDVLQLGKGMTIFGNTDNDRASMCANLYLNASTEFVRVMDGFSGRFAIEDGTMLWGLSATGDANTVVAVNTKMTLLNNGNLGIGTDSPDAKLHIYGSTSLSEMYLGEDADTDKAGILKYTQGDGSGTGFITLSHYGNTSTTQSLAIKYGGNVGIGTTSPNARLEVDAPSTTAPSLTIGAVAGQIFKNEDSELAFGLDNAAPYNVWMQSRFNGNVSRPLLINPLGGNVGIRTNSPNAPLDVTSKTSGSSGIQQWSYNSSPSSYRLQLNTIVSSGLVKFSFDQLNAGAGYNNVLVLDRGKVGIGTDSPNANGLTINKSGNHLFLSNTSTAAAIYWNFDVDSNNRLYIVTQPTATGVYISDGQTAWTGTSDESVKENIKPLEDVLEKIKDYRCVEYNLKIDKNKGKKIGFIAQDWENDFAPVIDKDKDGLLGMKYTETIPVLLKAIQELEARLKILENK